MIEQALIGALILEPKRIVDVVDIVSDRDFITAEGRSAFNTIMSMWTDGKHVDLVSVAQKNGNAVYLASATSDTFGPSAKQYAIEIATEARRKRVGQRLSSLVGKCSSGGALGPIMSELSAIYGEESSSKKKESGAGSVMSRFYDTVDANSKRGSLGFNTGIDFLDEKFIQYAPGQIWMMGGFTSVGKTAMMTNMVCNILGDKHRPTVCIISTEMTEAQMVGRIIANWTGIPVPRILTGEFYPGEEERVVQATSFLEGSTLLMHDDVYTKDEIVHTLKRHKMQGGLDIAFIDYVQNCKVPGSTGRYEEQADLANTIQKLAKDVCATIVCLSQVSNDVGRGNTDQLEFKGAGEWAQVADVGINLTRGQSAEDELWFDLKKNRHGEKICVVMRFENRYTRLVPDRVESGIRKKGPVKRSVGG